MDLSNELKASTNAAIKVGEKIMETYEKYQNNEFIMKRQITVNMVIPYEYRTILGII